MDKLSLSIPSEVSLVFIEKQEHLSSQASTELWRNIMRAASLRAWPRFDALSRLFRIGNEDAGRKTRNTLDAGMSDHLMRDLGFMEGRRQIGPERTRQSDELREALRLPPRPL